MLNIRAFIIGIGIDDFVHTKKEKKPFTTFYIVMRMMGKVENSKSSRKTWLKAHISINEFGPIKRSRSF